MGLDASRQSHGSHGGQPGELQLVDSRAGHRAGVRAPHRSRSPGRASRHPPLLHIVAPAAGSGWSSAASSRRSSLRSSRHPHRSDAAGHPGLWCGFSHELRCVTTVGTRGQSSLVWHPAVAWFTAELRCVACGRHPVSRRSPEPRWCARWGTPNQLQLSGCPVVTGRPATVCWHGHTAVMRCSAFVAGDGLSGDGRSSGPALAALGRTVPRGHTVKSAHSRRLTVPRSWNRRSCAAGAWPAPDCPSCTRSRIWIAAVIALA